MLAARRILMARRLLVPALLGGAALMAFAAAGSFAAAEGAPAGQVGGILPRRCLSCHNAEKKSGGVDLSTRMAAEAAGVLGPDDPQKNRLVRMISTGKMPPGARLPADETS